MIENTCNFCGDPCETILIDLYYDSAGFKAGTPVSECHKADFEPMTDEKQEEYEEEYWGEQEEKAHKARRIEQRRREQNDDEDEPIEED